MKTILAILALSALAFAANAQTSSRIYTFGTWSGGTNNISATSTNTQTETLACSEYDNVGVQITAAPSATCTGTVLFKFANSIDGLTFESTPATTITLTLAGTGAITQFNNISIPSTKTLKLVQTVNTNAEYMTNVVIRAMFKSPKRLPR